MKNSSAIQLEIDLPVPEEASNYRPTGPGLSSSHADAAPTAPLRVPDFARYQGMYAETARRASRLNASTVSDAEHKALLRARQSLLDKKFAGTMTRAESNKLEYIRWSLDRIEDARHGETLDDLEQHINRYEQFLTDIRRLQDQLSAKLPKGK